MQIWSQDLFQGILSSKNLNVQVSIVPSQADCSITINGTASATGVVTVAIGSTLTYTVTKTGYNPVSDSFLVIGPVSIPVTLTQLQMYTVGFTTVPTSAGLTLTCSDPNYRQQGTTKSIVVPDGESVYYTATSPNLDNVSGVVGPIHEDHTGTDAIEVQMRAKLQITPTPDTATVLLNGNQVSGTYFDCDEDVYYTVEAPGYVSVGTDAQNRLYFPKTNGYLTNTNLAVVLQKQALNFSVVLSPAGVTVGPVIEVKVNDGAWATKTSGETITVYMGDVVYYKVTYNDTTYADTSYTMGDASYIAQVLVQAVVYNVVITSVPNTATINLTNNTTGIITTGVGSVSGQAENGDQITYTASFGGATETRTATVSGQYGDQIVLNAQSSNVALVTNSTSISLQPGVYRCICVGAGGSSTAGAFANSGSRTSTAGHASGGGGSGYVTITEFTVLEQAAYGFNIGEAGFETEGGASYVTDPIGTVVATADGGKLPTSGNNIKIIGGDGGCGGGAAGGAGSIFGAAQSQEVVHASTKGANGGAGGGNGYSAIRNEGGAQILVYTTPGGNGFYGEEKSHGVEGGNIGVSTSAPFGLPGKGGTGLSSIQSTLMVASNFMTIDIQTLYNAMSGGGGGGPSYTPARNTTLSGNWYGGPGGGGGGWDNGEDGVNSATQMSVGGFGGSGAILYMRIRWE